MPHSTKRVTICSTSDYATDYRLHKTAKSLSDLGFDVIRLGRSCPWHITKPSADTKLMKLIFKKGPLFYAEINVRLFLFLIFSRTDIIYSVDLDTLPGCITASAIRRKPIIFDSHEYFPEVPELSHRPIIKKTWLLIERLFIKNINHGITVCQSIADIYQQKYGLMFEVVRNIPLATRTQKSQSIKLPDEPFVLLYQGAVNVGRGLEQMIEALVHLPKCHLVVVGDGDILADLKQLVIKLKISNQVSFEGKKPFEKLPEYMASTHLGLVLLENRGLNYYYSLPNRLFDFIQAGLPILGMNFPEMSAVINGHNVGLCVESLAIKEITDAISHLMNNREQLIHYKQNMARAASELTWENEFLPIQNIMKDYL